jgi:putative endonuclease
MTGHDAVMQACESSTGRSIDKRGSPRICHRRACPGDPDRETSAVKQYYLYILASRPGGALYIGVTSDLIRRLYEHKNGVMKGHTKRYGIDKLVYFEVHDSARAAIQREKNMKHWPRVWKTRTIAKSNPTWRDLSGEIV